MAEKQLILASTSKYRQELLSRLAYSFTATPPLIDEENEKDPNLSPQQLAEKLALLKAASLKGPGKVVIGGDQLVAFEGRILGKAHSKEKAMDQLFSMQGKTHELITAICVFDGDKMIPHTDITRMHMKKLSREQIERYVNLDMPTDCAGSYKIEKHGIMLFDSIESQDFTAIQGLPLIALSKILENAGL
ncbi:MAG: septum formation inhibitor Maf [Bdellovibrio sp. ArHS]|uniref:Maf family protein n=1 Tax=Bdellovibrio sp. ArHS TaxID=1569284 RepID=UPI0005839637|nr:nucleoside triphosphate pyrophosphatase [Bdellovibrio sp. ArHS]KHD88207.1 MAG: septum formation inhibitor Maf [Bdellovibrio sp. ArHS]